MNAHEFMASLAQGTPPQIYLLAGEEPYYIRRAEEAILRRLLPDAAARADALIRYEEMPAIDALAESLETAPFSRTRSSSSSMTPPSFARGKRRRKAMPLHRRTLRRSVCSPS